MRLLEPSQIVSSLLLVALAWVPMARARAQDPTEAPPRQRMAQQLVEFFEAQEPDAEAFLGAHIAAALIEREGREALTGTLRELHRAVHPGELDDLRPEASDLIVMLFGVPSGELELRARMAGDEEERLADLWIVGGIGLDSQADHTAPEPLAAIGWDNLDQRLDEESAWFSGVGFFSTIAP